MASLLQELAKKSPAYKAAVLVIVIILLGFAYYQVFYSDLKDKRTSLDNRKNSLNSQQRTLDRQLIEQEKLLAKNKELQRSIRDNQKALPTAAELPAFFDHLQRKAGDTGVSIHKWERLDEMPVDIFVRVPVQIEVTGTFYQIMHYFAALGPQQKDPLQQAGEGENSDEPRIDERIVSVENLSLGKARLQDGEIKLEASFVASTFRQKEGAKPPPGAPKAKKPAAGSSASKGSARSGSGGSSTTVIVGGGGGRNKNKNKPPKGRTNAPAKNSSSGGGRFGGKRRRRRNRERKRLGGQENHDLATGSAV